MYLCNEKCTLPPLHNHQILYPLLSLLFDLSQHRKIKDESQCARTDLNKRFLPKPMTTTG